MTRTTTGNCAQFTAQGARSVFAISTKLWANKSRPAAAHWNNKPWRAWMQPKGLACVIYKLDFIGVKIHLCLSLCKQFHFWACPMLKKSLLRKSSWAKAMATQIKHHNKEAWKHCKHVNVDVYNFSCSCGWLWSISEYFKLPDASWCLAFICQCSKILHLVLLICQFLPWADGQSNFCPLSSNHQHPQRGKRSWTYSPSYWITKVRLQFCCLFSWGWLMFIYWIDLNCMLPGKMCLLFPSKILQTSDLPIFGLPMRQLCTVDGGS